MDTLIVWFGVVFPTCCVIASLLIGRHYVVQARAAAKNAQEDAETSRLAALDADACADYTHAVVADLHKRYDEEIADPSGDQPPSVDDRPTEVMERVAIPEEEPDPVPLAYTPAQRLRAAGAGGSGKHQLAPSPVPRERREVTA